MTEEARLESVESGLTPVTPGWFVVNATRRRLDEQRCDGGLLHLRVRRVRPARPAGSHRVRQARRADSSARTAAGAARRAWTHAASAGRTSGADGRKHPRSWRPRGYRRAGLLHCPPGGNDVYAAAGAGRARVPGASGSSWSRDRAFAPSTAGVVLQTPRGTRRAGRRGRERAVSRPVEGRAPGDAGASSRGARLVLGPYRHPRTVRSACWPAL